MRIPHIINRNSLIVYTPSDVTLKLLYEQNRKLRSEEVYTEDNSPKSLAALCVITIANNFKEFPIIDKLVLCSDKDYLLEILPTDLPLTLVVPIIEDAIYWMRRYTDAYGVAAQHYHAGWTWKCIYLENYMQDIIANAQPEYNDEENMEDLTNLISNFVHRLVIEQLQPWKPPLNILPGEVQEVISCDHINLEPIFRRLQSVEELVLKYGMKNVGEKFSWNMFRVTINDAKSLGRALLNLKKLRLFDLHTSNFEDRHLQVLVQYLMKLTTLEELTIKNCLIGDTGALCIAKLMLTHQTLQRIVLGNNKIGARGGEGIGYALTQPECCPLKHLDLRLNPLGHNGVMGLFRALVRVQGLEELIISGVGFSDDTSSRLATVIQLNHKLKFIDFSNNWCKPGEKDLFYAVMTNTTLEWVDIRETNIDAKYSNKMMKKLKRNIKGETAFDSEDDEEDEQDIALAAMKSKIDQYLISKSVCYLHNVIEEEEEESSKSSENVNF